MAMERANDPILHDALCNNRNSSEYICYLIDKDIESVRKENWDEFLPLHIECMKHGRLKVVMKLLDIYPEAITIADGNDNIPLFNALNNYRSPSDVVLYLIDRYPEAV